MNRKHKCANLYIAGTGSRYLFLTGTACGVFPSILPVETVIFTCLASPTTTGDVSLLSHIAGNDHH